MNTQQPTVLLLAYTGYIIRDLLLGKFAQAAMGRFNLVAAVPDPDDPQLHQALAGLPVQLAPFPSPPPQESRVDQYLNLQNWMFRLKRVERANRSYEAVVRLFEPNLSGKRLALVNGMAAGSRLICRLGLSPVAEELFLSAIRRWPVTQQWQELLRRHKPDLVFSTLLTLPNAAQNPSVDLPPLLAARRLGIPTATLVQSWDNLSSKSYVLPTWLARYWTWSQAQTEELQKYNRRVDPQRVVAVGSPHFDYHLAPDLVEERAYIANFGLDPARPYVVIGTGVRAGLPDEPLTVARVAAGIHAALPEMQVLLRLHPKDDVERWDSHTANLQALGVIIQKPNLDRPMDKGGFTPPKAFFYEQLNTLRHAAAVISTASSIIVDASVLGRPVISLDFNANGPDRRFPEGRAWYFNRQAHIEPLIQTGGVWLAKDENDCAAAVTAYLADPALHADGRRRIVEMVIGAADGLAGAKLANEIQAIVTAGKN